MSKVALLSAPLGKTMVEAYCPNPLGRGKRWLKGVLVGRTREENPKFDVMLGDKTVVSCLPTQQVRVVSGAE